MCNAKSIGPTAEPVKRSCVCVCVKKSLHLHELIGIYQLDTTQTTKAQLL